MQGRSDAAEAKRDCGGERREVCCGACRYGSRASRVYCSDLRNDSRANSFFFLISLSQFAAPMKEIPLVLLSGSEESPWLCRLIYIELCHAADILGYLTFSRALKRRKIRARQACLLQFNKLEFLSRFRKLGVYIRLHVDSQTAHEHKYTCDTRNP